MCLEIYSPESPLEIHFEHEEVVFLTESSYEVTFTFLVQNCGSVPIHQLFAIYPRQLLGKPGLSIEGELEIPWQWQPPVDVTHEMLTTSIKAYFDKPTGVNDRVLLRIRDPNLPQFEKKPLSGLWIPNAVDWGTFPDLIELDIALLNRAGFSCWTANLVDPNGLQSHDLQWFRWKIVVGKVGDDWGPVVRGPKVVTHRVSSPLDVRRTMSEIVETFLTRAIEKNQYDIELAARRLLSALSLREQRRVDIRYYELSLWIGKPSERFIINWSMERDLRLRAGSPRIFQDGKHPLNGWALYEFKSGSCLLPDHSWKDEGFVLHFQLAYT